MTKTERDEIRSLIRDFDPLQCIKAERCLKWGERLLGLLREVVEDGGSKDLHPGLVSRLVAAIAEADGPPVPVVEDYFLQVTSMVDKGQPVWWEKTGRWTTDLNRAKRFTREQAVDRQHRSGNTEIAWLRSHIESLQRPAVSIEDLYPEHRPDFGGGKR